MQYLLLFVLKKEGKKCSLYYFLRQKICFLKKRSSKQSSTWSLKLIFKEKKSSKKNLQRKKIFKKWSSKKKIYNKDLQRKEIFNKDLKEKKSSKKIFKEKKILRKRSSLSGVGFEPTHMVASSFKSNALTTQPPRLAWQRT